jgi:hypothetical protein
MSFLPRITQLSSKIELLLTISEQQYTLAIRAIDRLIQANEPYRQSVARNPRITRH